MAYDHDSLDSQAERDKINEALRASDLWRDAIKAMGLNPDGPLKLSKTQQKQLAATIGLSTEDFHIDGAGNINDYHGWKGLPTAAKVAIVAGAAVATAGAAGAFSGGASGAAAAGGIAPAAAVGGTGAATAATAAAGAAATPSLWSKLAAKVPDFIGPAASMLTSGAQADAANRGTQIDVNLEQEKLRQQADRTFIDQMIARSAEDRAGQSDAWKKLQQSSYISGWKQPTAKFSPYAADLVAPGADVVAGANALKDQTRDSLMSGRYNTLGGAPLPLPTDGSKFQIDPKLLTGSMWERLQGYAGAGLGAYDAISRRPKTPPISTTQPVRG